MEKEENFTKKVKLDQDLVSSLQSGNEQAALDLINLYEHLIFKIARKYYNVYCYTWKEWLCELKSQFFIFAKEYNFDRGVYFYNYISKKLSWYACYELQKYIKDAERVTTLDFVNVVGKGKVIIKDWETVVEYVKKNCPLDFEVFRLYYIEGHNQVGVGLKVQKSQPTISRILNRIKTNLVREFGKGK